MARGRAPRSPAGLVPRRVVTHPVLVAAALLTVLLSTVVLTALLAFGGRVPEEGLTRVLGADPARAAVLVTAGGGQDAGTTADPRVRALAGGTLASVPADVVGAVQSAPFVLARGGRPPATGALTSFWAIDDLPDRADLSAGAWPAASADADGTVEVAVSAGAAAATGLEVGDRLALRSATFGPDVAAVVTGVYAPRDPADPVWLLDPTGGAGVHAGDHPSYGPLVVSRATLAARVPESTGASWLVSPDLSAVRADDLAVLADQLDALRSGATEELGSSALVTTGLDDLLDQAARSLVVSRSTTPVPALLLAVIAACAVAYVGRLLVGARAAERTLLRARGVSRGQDVRGALLEAAVLVLPAAVLTPVLVAAVQPAVQAAYGTTDPVPWTATVPVLAVVSLAAVTVLALPALPAPTGSGRGGRQGRPAWQRAGLDLVVLGLALLTYLLLRSAGSPFTAADLRDVRADPVFVLAPVVLLLAVAVLALRLLPPLGAAADRLTARARGAGVALGLWPVSRRPGRHAGPLLLLVLAVSVGVMAVAATATGARSRADQADFEVGADVRADLAPGVALPVAGLTLPGVSAAMPVTHLSADTGSRDGAVTPLLALDSSSAAEVVRLRPDLLPDGPAAYDDLTETSDGLPALATSRLLDARGLDVGDELDTVVAGTAVPVRVVGEVSAFPTLGAGEGLVVDSAALAERVVSGLPVEDQWWLAVDDGARPSVVAALAQRPEVAAVHDRAQVAADLADDPLAQGFAGALRVALVGGALLAAVGVAVGVLLAARERQAELALLEALGTPARQVRSALLVEQAVVVALGVALGLLVGLAVAWLVLPFTTVSARTGAVVPPAIITVPWPAVAALALVVGTTMLAVVLAVLAAARRRDVALTLREAAP